MSCNSSPAETIPEIMSAITLSKGVPVTTSVQVAGHFEKQHKHVLRDIRRIMEETPDKEWAESNFGLISHSVDLGHTTRQDPAYLITREGFMILGMGFTGPKAMGMKIAFIKAFTAMEKEILSLRGEKKALDEFGLTPAAKRLPVVQKVQLMNNATQIAKAESRVADVKAIYADLCNTVAEGSVPWAELAIAKGEDSVRDFVERCCAVDGNRQRRVLVSALYGAYCTWCSGTEEDYAPVSQNRFLDLLRRFAPEIHIIRPRNDAPRNRPRSVAGLILNRHAGMY